MLSSVTFTTYHISPHSVRVIVEPPVSPETLPRLTAPLQLPTLSSRFRSQPSETTSLHSARADEQLLITQLPVPLQLAELT